MTCLNRIVGTTVYILQEGVQITVILPDISCEQASYTAGGGGPVIIFILLLLLLLLLSLFFVFSLSSVVDKHIFTIVMLHCWKKKANLT